MAGLIPLTINEFRRLFGAMLATVDRRNRLDAAMATGSTLTQLK